jgi:hypothetical protein
MRTLGLQFAGELGRSQDGIDRCNSLVPKPRLELARGCPHRPLETAWTASIRCRKRCRSTWSLCEFVFPLVRGDESG